MKKFIKLHRSLFSLIVVTTVVLILLITLCILKNNVAFCEWWTTHIARGYLKFMGKITEWCPFSFTEVIFVIVVLSCLLYLVWAIILFKKKKILSAINRLLTITLVVIGSITTYVVSVELAYNRSTLPIGQYNEEIDQTKFKELVTYYVDDLNNIINTYGVDEDGELSLPYGYNKLFSSVRNTYHILDDNDYFNEYTAKIKPLMSSWLFSGFGISGMFFGPFGEAHYNTDNTNAELAFTIAHEMAHSKGVMREEDAQITALYICLNSEDPILRYSAYVNTLSSLLNLCRYTGNQDDYKEMYNKIDEKVWTNFTYINKHWDKKMWAYDFGEWWNNLYLKLSGQSSGTSSYSDSDTKTDDTGTVISLSRYQKVYLENYYQIINK